MPRNRVLSFMSQWGGQRSPTTANDADHSKLRKTPSPNPENLPPKQKLNIDTASPHAAQLRADTLAQRSPRSPTTPSRSRGDSRVSTRPNSMVQTFQPPQMEVAADTPPELQPIFSYLNSHSNKLYQEGYFLKLHDLDSRGRPSPSRVWNECFAQLAGTVLSLWDAAALDAAGEDGQVVPTFINLSDASIKMIESLPMNGAQGGSLQNVLSISTAANNRYLLHFNTLNSLTQWTAGIRLAMYEQATLQEAYTGSLIAGKGRYLNNIKQIMERSRFVYDDWARVRFGAGTVWQRCWCVITPPDEKEYAKAQKMMKKGSAYGRAEIPKGDIKFYDTRKVTKKTRPIATIKDAYAAYAIYPQSKPLIDQSTLVKLEGLVTIHTGQETTTEGFVFVMPEAHAAVSGFEMMLRWLFPVYDTFGLYGRPTRLVADTLDQRGLMFAMPKDRRYGYLDTLDVSGLIHTEGSQNWSERQWRKEMKKLTSARMTAHLEDSPRSSRQIGARRNTTSRNSLPPTRGAVQFQTRELPIHSSPGSRSGSPGPGPTAYGPPRRTDSAPPSALPMASHKRAVSDVHGYRKHMNEKNPSRLSQETRRDDDDPPTPPMHGGSFVSGTRRSQENGLQRGASNERNGTESPYDHAQDVQQSFQPPAPVLSPPAFTHSPSSRPQTQPYQAPELRRAHSNVDAATLHQMHEAVRPSENGSEYTPDQSPQDGPSYHEQMLQAGAAQGVVNYGERDPRQRLSTIPASPEVAHRDAYFHASSMDGVVDNGNHPQASERPELVAIHSSHSINRKPVPRQAHQGTDEAAPQTSQVRESEPVVSSSPSSDNDFNFDGVINDEALARILDDDSRASTFASSATPDYASTVSNSEQESKKKEEPAERPRAGKLKTVGNPDMPVAHPRSGGAGKFDTYSKQLAEQNAEIPTVDFGPTYAYKPSSRPGTSGTITPGDMDKRQSRRQSSGDRLRGSSGDRLRASSRDRLSGYFGGPAAASPVESHRQSYFGGRSTPTGVAPADTPGNRNSVAWTPSGVTPGAVQQTRQSLTPEQWVQWRASVASQPQPAAVATRKSATPLYAHQRQSSSPVLTKVRQATKTPPPFSRSPSGDWTQQGQQRTPPSRPVSRGAGVYLNQGNSRSTSNLSSMTLTAKEQMHVARSTGTPLINMASGGKAGQEQESGLIGALANRQREKAAISQGLRSEAVQQAILSRQQQALMEQLQIQMENEAQARAEYEMQQRYSQRMQAGQFEQMAYQQSLLMQQQQAQMQYQQQLQSRASWYGPLQAQQGYNVPSSQASAYGGQYVQQQQRSYSGSPYVSQQGGQPRR